MAYTLTTGLARAKERCQRSDTADDAYLTELLELSKGTTPLGGFDYRPFWVAAKFIAQDPDLRDLSEAVGEAKFTLAQPRIDDLMALQLAYDQANNLTVPAGCEAFVPATAAATRAGQTAVPLTTSIAVRFT